MATCPATLYTREPEAHLFVRHHSPSASEAFRRTLVEQTMEINTILRTVTHVPFVLILLFFIAVLSSHATRHDVLGGTFQ